jgi:hypothetical protein
LIPDQALAAINNLRGVGWWMRGTTREEQWNQHRNRQAIECSYFVAAEICEQGSSSYPQRRHFESHVPARWWHGKLLGAQCGQRIDVRGAAGGEKAGSIPAPATFFKEEGLG